jgi:hypothetical protein
VLAFAPGGIVGIARSLAERAKRVVRRETRSITMTADEAVPVMAASRAGDATPSMAGSS